MALPKVMETLQTKEHEYTVKVSKSSTTVILSKLSYTVTPKVEELSVKEEELFHLKKLLSVANEVNKQKEVQSWSEWF